MKYPPRVPSLTADLHKCLVSYYFGTNPPQSFDARVQLTANRIVDLERLHGIIAANPGTSRTALKSVQLDNISLQHGLKVLVASGVVIRAHVKSYNGGYGYWSVIA